MKKHRFLSFCYLMLTAWVAMAQDSRLKVHFDFTQVDGSRVTDVVSGISAQAMNDASFEEMGDYHVLNLGSGSGYLSMGRFMGLAMKDLTDYTFSMYYRVDRDASLSGSGFFLWSFSNTAENTETSGVYSAYRLNVQRMASSGAGWGSEVGFEVGKESRKGTWMHVLYRQKGSLGQLFVDGKAVAQSVEMPSMKDLFKMAPRYCWIGRAPFVGDSYLRRTRVADIRLYDAALSDEEISGLASNASRLETAYRYGKPGDFSTLEKAVAEAEELTRTSSVAYAPNAVAELNDVLQVAQAELAARKASQVLINEYVSSLNTLAKKVRGTEGFQYKRGIEYHAGNQGFVHPGCIVSQKDIDRAKQLIKEKNDRMLKAWNILCSNQYAQSNVATWPTEVVLRGIQGDNYMNCARGAAMAFQNALRWKIGGTREHADAAVRILMQWARTTKSVGGNTNLSLASGIYGHEFANAAELMRDYDGWSREDFEEFKRWMVEVWYNPAIDFLRRRHDTWMNFRHPAVGIRPGHYWSNWGLCNVLCVMSIGILCDDVHMYNQGVSFYKYDHVGTFKDRSKQSIIYNDGCNEFIGNLVPVVLPDNRGPFGYLGQMQESGRDQGHSLMALGCALDVCQIGFNQGDDLFAYMDDRIAAGTEYVAAQNFGGVDPANLPWIMYEYADCAGQWGSSWKQPVADSRGVGEWRPEWDRVVGYYQGLRGVKLRYAGIASNLIGPDGGGGNYSPNSGGFDHLGFTTLTHWRPAIDPNQAITPLTGDMIYKGETLKNQTNLGGLKYDYWRGTSKAIPADGADITLIPQLPDGVEDTGLWQWSTGETMRRITVKADHSFIYRVTYTAANGRQSHQSFAIAVAGDAQPDRMSNEITVDGVIEADTVKTVLSGTDVILYAEARTGWTDDYLWDNGSTGTVITVPHITTSRVYTCQYANQSGAVSQKQFHLNVVPALQYVTVDGGQQAGSEAEVFPGAEVKLTLQVPMGVMEDMIVWQDGSTGSEYIIPSVGEDTHAVATYDGVEYAFDIKVRASDYTYYTDHLTPQNGYVHVTTLEQLENLAAGHYFVLCADEADLMVHLDNGKENGNLALFYQTSQNPLNDLTSVFTLEPFEGGYCLRNILHDGLLLQTEMNAPWNMRTHDQPYPISWARFLLAPHNSAWTVENGTYAGNWLGLWYEANGYTDGEELACNKTDEHIAHFQLFAIAKTRFHADYLHGADEKNVKDATPLIQNPEFAGFSWALWNVKGTFGNQRFNGAAETWHSTDFEMTQTLEGLPFGSYTVSCQMVNGEGNNTGCLFATTSSGTQQAVVSKSCAGSDFDTERNRMAADNNYAKLSLDVEVGEDGLLTFGIKEPTNGTTWLVFDNFRLTYHGINTVGIQDVGTARARQDGQAYDLQGRKVENRHLQKGIYIVNGRKIIQ